MAYQHFFSEKSRVVDKRISKNVVQVLLKYLPKTKFFWWTTGYEKAPHGRKPTPFVRDEDIKIINDIAEKYGRSFSEESFEIILDTINHGESRLVKAALFSASSNPGDWFWLFAAMGGNIRCKVIPQLLVFLRDDFEELCRVNPSGEQMIAFTVAFLSEECHMDISEITPPEEFEKWARGLKERARAAESRALVRSHRMLTLHR